MGWTDPRTWVTDELVTAALFNTHIRDNFNSTWHLIARKTADESRTSNTTFTDDAHLSLAVAANEVWQFQYMLITQGSTAGDFKFQWTFPAGAIASVNSTLVGTTGANTTYILDSGTSPLGPVTGDGTASATSPRIVWIAGFIINGGSAGNFTLQWAQNSSSATASTLRTNSALWGAKLA
jgi:hypothetical protein